MKRKVQGSEMMEFLGGLAPGDPVWIEGREWCSLDDWGFSVCEDGDSRVLEREEAEAMFEPDRFYEVTR